MAESLWRIGELSRRVGVSTEVLRAWERRYGLLEPQRTPGRYRLYSAGDEQRVRRVLTHRAAGHATAEAVRMALAETPAVRTPPSAPIEALGEVREQLLLALQSIDAGAAQSALDRVLARTDLETALVSVILPVLASIGDLWASGQIGVAVEHHASNVVQARLLGLARGWDEGDGPLVVLACAPGELHAIGLIAFGLVLRERGWRIAYLGADMPIEGITGWVREHKPDAVVISTVASHRFVENERELGALAAVVPLVLGGAGAAVCAPAAERMGALAMTVDPVAGAQMLGQWLARA